MIPADQVRFIAANLLAVPFSFVLRQLKGQTIRKYFSLIIATLLQTYVYRYQMWMPFALHTIMYAIITKTDRKQCGKIATISSLFIVSVYHIYRMWVDYYGWNMDVSVLLMCGICKYSLFAFSYQDGGDDRILETKYKQRIDQRIIQKPEFIDFLSYSTFLPTCILNTPLDYSKYKEFIRQEKHFLDIPLKESLYKIGQDFVICLISLIGYAIHKFFFPLSYAHEQDFLNKSGIYIYFYSLISIYFLMGKYFFGFKISQLSVHASGISYQPSKDNQDSFLGVQTCNPLKVLFAFDLRQKIANWNMQVQEWLRKCIYQRFEYDRTTSKLFTFLLSAFWHGFYGGQYISFILWFMQIQTAVNVFKLSHLKQNALVIAYYQIQPYSYWLLWMLYNFTFTQNAIYFLVQSGPRSIDILSALNFIIPIILLVVIILFKLLLKNTRKNRQQSKNEPKSD